MNVFVERGSSHGDLNDLSPPTSREVCNLRLLLCAELLVDWESAAIRSRISSEMRNCVSELARALEEASPQDRARFVEIIGESLLLEDNPLVRWDVLKIISKLGASKDLISELAYRLGAFSGEEVSETIKLVAASREAALILGPALLCCAEKIDHGFGLTLKNSVAAAIAGDSPVQTGLGGDPCQIDAEPEKKAGLRRLFWRLQLEADAHKREEILAEVLSRISGLDETYKQEAFTVLMYCLGVARDEPVVSALILECIGELKEAARRALPLLFRLAEQSSLQAAYAAYAAAKICPVRGGQVAVELFERAMNTSTGRECFSGVYWLGELLKLDLEEKISKRVVERLVHAVKHPEVAIRAQAISSFSSRVDLHEKLLPLLARQVACAEQDPYVRVCILRVLEAWCSQGDKGVKEGIVPLLNLVSKDAYAGVREVAVELLKMANLGDICFN